ncbi:MAG: hypothetical protein JWL91_2231 [Sphingomonas bacterium]|nr:helix-turn-helix domain-containing protein [Sphingomonas bacterium]MDB5690355.1 hypothetical protein [Sphingomonas bacterium]
MQDEIRLGAGGIAALAADVRTRAALGKSALMNRLFDFLLEQSLAGRSPKEVEVAREVFGKDARFDISQDASVRVYIHRLRRKLDEVYRDAPGERLIIPRGEYRLAIAAPAGAEVADAPSPVEGEEAPAPGEGRAPIAIRSRRRSALALLAALLAGLVLGAVLWSLTRPVPAPDRAAAAPFWRPLSAAGRATYLVTGDYYIFGEAREGGQVTRLVREFAINSRADLDQYLMMHPDEYSRYVDLDLHYLPVSAGSALRDIVPVANAATAPARPRVVAMSRMTPEMLKSANIVYVGFLSALGLLRDPLFDASGFEVGASYDELVDRATGKHYVSDWEEIADNRTPHRDYAYLASFPGPSGNRVLIVAGTRDPAVMQAAEIAGDRAQLDRIAAAAGKADAFEALYEVRMMGTLNLDSRLVLARPLKVAGLWQAGVPAQNFPDDPASTPDPGAGPPPAR